MADQASAYLGGVNAGEGIADRFSQSFYQARSYADRLNELSYQHQQAAKAAKAKADQVQAELGLKGRQVSAQEKEAEAATTRAASEAESAKGTEALRKSQSDLYEAEAKAIASGRGRNGTGAPNKTPVDLAQANKNLESARKALSAYAVGGQKPPQEIQDVYHAALADVDRLSQGLGLHPATHQSPAAPVAPPDNSLHPIDATMNWFKNLTGSSPQSAGDVQTRTLKDGTQVLVRRMPDGSYEKVQ